MITDAFHLGAATLCSEELRACEGLFRTDFDDNQVFEIDTSSNGGLAEFFPCLLYGICQRIGCTLRSIIYNLINAIICRHLGADIARTQKIIQYRLLAFQGSLITLLIRYLLLLPVW